MPTPSGRQSTITTEPKPQSPPIIPSDEESISSQSTLPPSIDIYSIPQPLNKFPPTEPSDATLHKNSIKTLSICTLDLIYIGATSLPPIPPSLTPSPCENWTQFESLNIHRIFVCRKFYNQKHCTAATNASLVNSDLLLSTICSFSNIANPPKLNPIKKKI